MKLTSICFALAMGATFVCASASAQDTIGTDLLAYWDFNETEGTTCADYNNAATGTMGTGVTHVDGPVVDFGKAVYFDGTAGTAIINLVQADSVSSPDTNKLTWSYWIKFDKAFDTTGWRNYEGIVNSASGQDYFIVYKDNYNKQVRMKIIAQDTAQKRWCLAGTELPSIGAWHHMACVWDGDKTSDNMAWYVDGVKAVNCIDPDPTVWPTNKVRTSQTTCIGAKTNSNGQELQGSIDDLAMWKRALPEQEIQFIYNNGKQLKDILNVKAEVSDWSLM
ncbi:MAG: LamG domain-containing protein [Candidatus Sumerlaeales bacterium]|nr:LamG domain-containing protein [Candidatus Sumerlaeales bacterium]